MKIIQLYSFLASSVISVSHKSHTSHAEPPCLFCMCLDGCFRRGQESPRTVGALLLIAMN